MRYGGNTACVSVQLADGSLVVIDCGTGARNLGLSLMAGPFGQGRGRATLLLSHAHWDHIQGFPFFNPFYVGGNQFVSSKQSFGPLSRPMLVLVAQLLHSELTFTSVPPGSGERIGIDRDEDGIRDGDE